MIQTANDLTEKKILSTTKEFHRLMENRKKNAEQKIKQMKDQAIKDIRNVSVELAIISVEKLIKNSIDKSKLDKIYSESIEETKLALQKKSVKISHNNMAKKIIVIGSGFGGLAASLRLKAKGYDVTLVEKHPDLGGRARVFKKGNFIYDGGPTVITAPYLFEELFILFNKKISDYVDIVPLDLWYRFVFNDGKTFDYSGDEKSMEKEVKKFSDKDFKGYNELVDFTEKIFNKGFTDLSDKPFSDVTFMLKQVPSLLSLKSYKSVYQLVSNYISNEKLRRVFSMHPLLVGGNPFTTTSIYTLILFLEKKWGIHYSMGGTGKVVDALEKLMKEENIKILKNAEVTEIISKADEIEGVKINNSEIINCNYVVCNSDPPNVYQNLIKSKNNYSFFLDKNEKDGLLYGIICLLFWIKKTIQKCGSSYYLFWRFV